MNSSITVSAGIVAIVATILILVSGRRDADAERQRTFARYVDSVNLLSVFVALFAAYALVAQLTRFIIPERQRFGSGPGLLDVAEGTFGSSDFEDLLSRGNDAIWRSAVQALLVLLVAGVILAFHRRQRGDMVTGPGFDSSSAARVDQAYRYAVCFVAVFVILMAGAFGLYGVFRIAAPGVTGGFGGGQREQGIAQAVSLLALGGGAFVVFRMHWTDTMVRFRREATDSGPAIVTDLE